MSVRQASGTTRRSVIDNDVLHDRPLLLKPLSFSKEEVYSLPGTKLALDTTCGELFERLMSICLAQPEFLRPETAHRYLQLLPELGNFTFHVRDLPLWSKMGLREGDIQVNAAPIRALMIPLEFHINPMASWIFACFRSESHPILASYALDLSQFVAHMVNGFDSIFTEGEGDRYRIEPLVANHEARVPYPDAGFKKRFTEASRLHRVLCHVPADSSAECLIGRLKGSRWEPGQDFFFHVERCYLSSGFDDYEQVRLNEPYRRDMQSEFNFYGGLEYRDSEDTFLLKSNVPAHWIIASVEDVGILPVPFRPINLGEIDDIGRVQ